MARRKTLTQTQLAKLPRRAKRYYLADPVQQASFCASRRRAPLAIPPSPGGAGNSRGKPWDPPPPFPWMKPARSPAISAAKSKVACRARRRRCAVLPPSPTSGSNSASTARATAPLPSADASSSATSNRVSATGFSPNLRRSDIADLLDVLAEEHGKAMADQTLKVLSAISHWYESRNDEYRSPLTRGMRRAPATPASALSATTKSAPSGNWPTRAVRTAPSSRRRC